MRAELFGYRKGAFTGATSDREGLLAAADGDTLFLDEVGDVSPDLQRLLIKAIEEKEYLPLGDNQPRKSDFRLLTATNVEGAEPPAAARPRLPRPNQPADLAAPVTARGSVGVALALGSDVSGSSRAIRRRHAPCGA